MFYVCGGRIYAPRNNNGLTVYDRMAVRLGEDNAPHIVNDGGSLDKLPSGAVPMTDREVLARMPCEAPKPKKSRKAVKTDVSEL